MSVSQRKRLCAACVVLLSAGLWNGRAAHAQSAAPQARVVQAPQNDKMVMLRGNVHPMARPRNDRGSLPDQQPVTRMQVLLQRSAEQETALQQLLAQQLDPASPKFHGWLTPQEFGEQFGPAESDVQAVKDWLTSQGFTGLKVNNGKTLIEFDGTAGQVRNALRTEMHRLSANGEDHFGNMEEPQIPAALAPVVSGVIGLHDFHPKPMLKRLGKFRRDMKTGAITPLFTFTDVNGTFYGVGPADFAKIYNLNSIYAAGFDGTGQKIAIVGRSNINIQDVRDFRTIFGLPANDPQIILNGADPGLVSGDEGESDLDVEWAGAVAPKAKIILVASQSNLTDVLDGVAASAGYIVDNNIAPVLSMSYGLCETDLGTAGNAFYNALWQQAAAQGITVIVSSGDSGSAGCDSPNTETSATNGIGVSGIASTPYNISMGGTDFDQANNQTAFWNPTNGSPSQLSAKGYIPETTWNDSCANAGLTGCNSVTSSSPSLNIVAGSGGPSSVYPKPSWQSLTITGMPNDGHRDTPDVSLFASDGQNKSFYIVCQSDQNIPGDTGCNLTNFSTTTPFHDFQAVGGTSAGAPAFAGIIALVNQKTGQRQGNANLTLYSMAQSEAFASCNSTDGTSGSAANTTCVFNDITKGNISVPCAGGTLNCSKTSSGGFGVIASGGHPAFGTTLGYDLATGLGSVNVANLINKWLTPSLISTSVSLSPATITGTVGTTVTLSGAVTKSSGSATPSGVVVFENAATGVPAGNIPPSNILVGSISGNPATLNSNGTYNVSTTFLPAGTYSLKTHYGGDTIFAPSDSTPIAVTLIKQDSRVLVSFVNAAGNLVTGNQSVAYGSDYILRVDVENASGTPCQNATGVVGFICPTGTVSLFDNGTALTDFPNAQTPNASSTARVNDRGFAEDQPIQLNVGTHAITATYSADATSSYNSNSSSNSLSITITQATTTTTVVPSPSSITAGGNVTLTATVSTNSNSAQGPTGTVQFLVGGTNLGAAATCTTAGASSAANASCTATLTTALSFMPPGFISRPRPTTPYGWIAALLAALLALLSFLLATRLAARQSRYAYAGLAFFLMAAVVFAGCSGSGNSGGGGGGSTRSITAHYSGDTNYAASTSSAATVTVR
jgi:hypothetical protein